MTDSARSSPSLHTVLAAVLSVTLLASCPGSVEDGFEGPPTVSITEPASECVCINPGDSLSFSATFTNATGFAWSGPPQVDGQFNSNLGPTVFPDKGVFIITANAGTSESTASDQVKVIVRDNCTPLVAAITAPPDDSQFELGTIVAYTSAASGGDAPYTYEWSFVSESQVDATTADALYTHMTAGNYTVRLKVTDAVGDSVTASIDVTIVVPFEDLLTGPRSLPVAKPDGLAVVRGEEWAGQVADYIVAIAHETGATIFDPVDEVTLDDEFDGDATARVGVLPVAHAGGAGLVSALLRFGSSSVLAHHRDGDWDFFQMGVDPFSFVSDATSFGGGLETEGFVAATAADLNFFEWDPISEFFQFSQEIQRSVIDPASFQSIATAYASETGDDVLVVLGGSPGTLYVHDRSSDPGVVVGQVGDTPRQIRCLDGVFFVTNFASDSGTIGTWDGVTATITATVGLGDGPIGVDLLSRPAGKVAAVTTGFGDDTMTVTVIDADGLVESSVTTALPAGITQAAHGAWAGDTNDRIILSGFGTDNLYVVDSGL